MIHCVIHGIIHRLIDELQPLVSPQTTWLASSATLGVDTLGAPSHRPSHLLQLLQGELSVVLARLERGAGEGVRGGGKGGGG